MADPRPRSFRRYIPPFLTLLTVFGLLHGYVAKRLFIDPQLPWPLALLGCTLVGLLVVVVPVGFIFSRRDRGWPSRVFPTIAIFWLGASGILLTTTVAADLARGLLTLLEGVPSPAHALSWARLEALAIVLSTALLVPFAIWTARGRLVLSRVRVPVERLAPGLAGLRIVQISDLHIGERLGDLTAPHGVYFVTGNHEYYWGGEESVAAVEGVGVTVLHNAHRVVERDGGSLVIGGIPDLHGAHFLADHQARPDLAFAGAPEGVPRILLAHQPKNVSGAAQHGVSLLLSGHTHGGQIFPGHLFVRLQQPVVRGLRKLLGVWVYAHRGTGFWGPPMRLFSTPEIAEITLEPA